MSKNVAVFVDVANIFYAAKAAGVDIDYVTLLKSATAGRDLVRAYAYTGLDPDNENQRNFHSFLARHGFKVVSKDIRKYGDGKVKANLDIELVVDMLKTARNLDIAIVVSGDGDFAPAIRAVQEMGVRVEVISFRGNTSSDLIDVADQFTDIAGLARVEKGSSRSGRRIAGDDQDLSMTEVPDKQTEGTTTRGRGRTRTRAKPGAEPVAAAPRSRRSAVAKAGATHVAASGLVALPGEKLSKASSDVADGPIAEEVDEPVQDVATGGRSLDDAEGEDLEAGTRRRRRRGGRGRGRGRGRPEGVEQQAPEPLDEDQAPVPEAPRMTRTTPFGSVWDSQLGVPTVRREVAPLPDDEDFDEPEIPEYLIAERRQDRGGRGGARFAGGRGARSGYAAAVDRERYGRGSGGGINRYPDVGSRDRGPRDRGGRGGRDTGFGRPPRQDRPDRADRGPGRGPGSTEPWSEVPPEVEAMLRAQLQSRPRSGPESPAASHDAESAEASVPVAEEAAAAPRRGGRRTRTAVAASEAPGESTAAPAESEAPRPATRRRTAAAATAEGEAPKRTVRRRATAAADTADTPRRTTRRRTTSGAEPEGSTGAAGEATEAAAPKRRTTRRKTDAAAEPQPD